MVRVRRREEPETGPGLCRKSPLQPGGAPFARRQRTACRSVRRRADAAEPPASPEPPVRTGCSRGICSARRRAPAPPWVGAPPAVPAGPPESRTEGLVHSAAKQVAASSRPVDRGRLATPRCRPQAAGERRTAPVRASPTSRERHTACCGEHANEDKDHAPAVLPRQISSG